MALLLFATGARATGTPIQHGTLELIAESQWIEPGHPFYLALHIQLEKGWHIYWVNPGDSGDPPRVTWQLPAGLTAGPIQWPTPQRLSHSSIADFGYDDTVTLIVPMHAPANLAVGESARLGAEVKVLVCREICIPGKEQLTLTLPIKSQPPLQDPQTVGLFAAARKSLPRPIRGNWKFSVSEAKDSFDLTAIHQSSGCCDLRWCNRRPPDDRLKRHTGSNELRKSRARAGHGRQVSRDGRDTSLRLFGEVSGFLALAQAPGPDSEASATVICQGKRATNKSNCGSLPLSPARSASA